MTFTQWQQFATEIGARGRVCRDMIRQRAVEVGEAHGFGQGGQCFGLARNWLGQDWMTPAQNHAARFILHLERKSWQPSALAERIISRAWDTVKLTT